MDFATARHQIQSSFKRMDALYERPVFDEWIVLSVSAQKGILGYSGPRPESFRQQFPEDVEPLRTMLAGRPMSTGEFEFASDAGGTRFDACLKTGATSFLVCNHTTGEMSDIRRDQRWLNAQTAFFELCEKFRADPLEV